MRRTPLKSYTGLKTKTPLRAKTGFKRKATKPMRRTKLRKVGTSETSLIKGRIQELAREIVIIRDGGCILRNYPGTGKCGGYTVERKLILQAEHLETRSNSLSYADTRLIVCLCKNHHGFFKPNNEDKYYEIVKQHIGKERTALLEEVQKDRSPHKMDWKVEEQRLILELEEVKKQAQELNPFGIPYEEPKRFTPMPAYIGMRAPSRY